MTTTSPPITVVTFNVRGFPAMLQRRVRHDLLLAFGLHAHLYGWQEFWWPRYRRALRRLGLEAGFNSNAPNNRAGTATSYDRARFGFLEAGHDLLHQAVAFVCSRREITWTRLWDRSSGLVVTHVCTHPVPGAWNPRQRFRKAARRQAWVEGMDRFRAFLEAEAEAGRFVIATLDGNCPRSALLNLLGTHLAGQPVRVQGHQPDWVVIVGRAHVLETAQAIDGANSDHQPVRVVVQLWDRE